VIESETLRAAEAHLRRRDKKLARVIDAHGLCTLDGRRRDPFHILCSSIISQQLSSRAADTIQARVAAATLAGARFKPAAARLRPVQRQGEMAQGRGRGESRRRRLLPQAGQNG
jgi:DNA-3-methyladenine glycosylase II